MVFMKQKRIIDELEGSFTGAPIYATNPEVPTLDVEANSDELITSGAKFNKMNKYRYDMEI